MYFGLCSKYSIIPSINMSRHCSRQGTRQLEVKRAAFEIWYQAFCSFHGFPALASRFYALLTIAIRAQTVTLLPQVEAFISHSIQRNCWHYSAILFSVALQTFETSCDYSTGLHTHTLFHMLSLLHCECLALCSATRYVARTWRTVYHLQKKFKNLIMTNIWYVI